MEYPGLLVRKYDSSYWSMFFDTRQELAIRRSKWQDRVAKNDLKAKLHLEKVTMAEDVDLNFLFNSVKMQVIVTGLWYSIVEHLSTRKDWSTALVPFSLFSYPTPRDAFDYFLMGCLMLMMVDRLVAFNHILSYFCKAPLYKAMRHPYYSASVGDFWSNRWNGFTQESLRRGIFGTAF
jgi:hypothetical protein